MQVILVARLRSLRYTLHFLLMMLEKCVVMNLMNIYDAFNFLVETIVRNDHLLAQAKKEKKQLNRELAKVKFELQKWTTMFHAKKGVVDNFDVSSSKSLENAIGISKDACAGLESHHSKGANDFNAMLGMSNARDLENQMLGQSITMLKAQNGMLETELSNLKNKIASECAIASVSPRCEANNLLDDRVRILQLENLNLNTIIRNFTSSQHSLNMLVGSLGNYSIGHGLGFQSDIIQTKPKKAKLNKFENFLSHPSSFYSSDIDCLNAKLKC